jgi:hypothetical protein
VNVIATAFATLALAAGVQPAAGDQVSGRIGFPRPQPMTISVAPGDRLSFSLGFDGRCSHGGIGELWIANVVATSLPVRDGRFSGVVRGSDPGVVRGRRTSFWWKVSGVFTGHRVAAATIDGHALVRAGSHVISRCEITRPARVSLR